jgi:hypothetical protein
MATLKEVQEKADVSFDALWSSLGQAQDAFFSANGRFFQSLTSPVSEVKDAIDSAISYRPPVHEAKQADVQTEWTSDAPFQVEVHEWVGPTGKGFTLVATMKTDDGLMKKMRSSDGVTEEWAKTPELR